jgi:hypothetical protein
MYKKNIIELQIWEMEEKAVTPSSAKVFKGIQARGMAEIVVKSVIHRDGQVSGKYNNIQWLCFRKVDTNWVSQTCQCSVASAHSGETN